MDVTADLFAPHSPEAVFAWFDDLERTIDDSGCDVVDICVPNVLHHRATVAAARAGKHIIIEKPFAMTLEEADEMIAACDAAGRHIDPVIGPASAGGIVHSLADISMASRLLGYRVVVPFQEGIRSTVSWFATSRSTTESG